MINKAWITEDKHFMTLSFKTPLDKMEKPIITEIDVESGNFSSVAIELLKIEDLLEIREAINCALKKDSESQRYFDLTGFEF